MMKRMMFVGVGIAVALFFMSGVVAASEDDAPVVSFEDTPYIDADGNIDYELAKDYAELVDSYTDESETKWEVWLDEIGGHMWAEYLTIDGVLGDEDLLVPSWISLVRSGLDSAFYNLSGSGDGDINYIGTCGTACFKWGVCHYPGYSPIDIDSVQAKAVSDEDYCDANYDAVYDFPNGVSDGWLSTDHSCGTSGSSYYMLYSGTPDGNDDYEYNENMVRWHVHVTGAPAWYIKVVYRGSCIA